MNRTWVQEATESLFTMSLVLDRDFKILDSSARLQYHCPDAVEGQQLKDIFDIHRPRGIRDVKDIIANNKSLFLLIHHSGNFALRGQVICSAGEDSQWFIFLGSPWFSWITERSPETKLELVDFPRHDAQMDQSFYMATQHAMVQDLEKVNEALISANDAAESAKKIQSDFFAVMSHEMRTPLNGVISALNLIADSKRPAEKAQLLNVAHNSAKNLLSVINYVLDYSKLESDELAIEKERFDLHEVLSSVTDILHAKAAAASNELVTSIHPECPRHLTGDASKIQQVLINLASNAVKFTDNGRVEIRVNVTAQEDDDVMLCFEVEDTGIGIPEEQHARIFDAFWSSHSQTAKGEANTGLGLNICQRITTLLGGELSFRSKVGEGTCFVMTLPLKMDGNTLPRTSVAASSPEKFSGEVLLVDDNQTNLLVGSMMLERLGLAVRTASDGQEAVDLTAQVPFDLVLMDITMPEMDGETATRAIRARGSQTPIIALTAHIGDENRARYLSAGMQDVIHKPIDKGELLRALSAFLPEFDEPEAAAANDSPAVELLTESVLETLIDSIGQSNFSQAFELLQAETESRIQRIISCWVQRDVPSIAREAHTIKSSAASFGASALAQHMKLVEEASQQENIPLLVELVPQIEKLHEQTFEAFAAFNQKSE